ncbi:MAG: dihydroorotate dehydrogenase [Elusimicrobiales bacterium]|nr:dihydroorotate dehydrogenase [Elusimicrobiales bacterium]
MVQLEISIGGLRLKNPVMTASGTFGHGTEFAELYDINRLGAVVTKTITPLPRAGNPPPRMAETPSGMLNAVGLQNGGLEEFLKNKAPFLRRLKTAVVVSISAGGPAEFADMALAVETSGCADALELNLSCPNVLHGAVKNMISQDCGAIEAVVSAVRKKCGLAAIAKLSPNVTDITKTALAAQNAGADAVCLINTLPAMSVDLKTRKPRLANITGGLSGPAIKPVALKLVWDAVRALDIPVIACGGITTAEDALEFILCGATAVEVGTANLTNPFAAPEILSGMERWLRENKIASLDELRGKLIA